MTKHIMIDLETMDTLPTTVVLSCGAVFFDPEAETIDKTHTFLAYPNLQEQLDNGRTISADTLLWWMKQSSEARGDWIKARQVKLDTFRENFRTWCGDRMRVWSNGSCFDVAIMENLLEHTRIPWRYWDIRDTRTLWDIHPYDKSKKEETAHTALEDAIAQAERVIESWPK